MLYIHTIVILVEFTQLLFAGDETTGFLEATIRASGFSQLPYEVIVMTAESDPPDALGITYIYIFMIHMYNFDLVGCVPMQR